MYKIVELIELILKMLNLLIKKVTSKIRSNIAYKIYFRYILTCLNIIHKYKKISPLLYLYKTKCFFCEKIKQKYIQINTIKPKETTTLKIEFYLKKIGRFL